MKAPLSVRTYSTGLLCTGPLVHATALRAAMRDAGRRVLPDGSDAVDSLRSLTVLVGPRWEHQAEALRARVAAARRSHGFDFPVLAALLPGCGVTPGGAETALDFAAMPIDLRNGASADALRDVAWRTPSIAPSRAARRAPLFDGIKAATIRSYDAIAEQFAAVWDDHAPLDVLERLLERLPARARVLDAGCGPGHHAAYLARRGHRVTGIDLSMGMLRLARARHCNAQFLQMDLEHLRFGGRFDAIWCAAAAMHVPRERLPGLLAGFRRALGPGGLLGLNLQVGRPSEVACHGDDKRFFEYYSGAAEIGSMLARAGFDIVGAHYGETGRNTHGAPLTLRWQTLFARTPSTPDDRRRPSCPSPGTPPSAATIF